MAMYPMGKQSWPRRINAANLTIVEDDPTEDKSYKNLANGKASGISGIFAEVLKAISETVTEPICELFSFCLQHKVVPTSSCRARIHPIPKKKSPFLGIGCILARNTAQYASHRCLQSCSNLFYSNPYASMLSHWPWSKVGLEPTEGLLTKLPRYKSGFVNVKLSKQNASWGF
jgi:hypothetical protein